MARLHLFVGILLFPIFLTSCSGPGFPGKKTPNVSPCAVALADLGGSDPLDNEIARLQKKARTGADSRALEDLGQRLIAKARLTHDAGYYRLAEDCARCLESKDPGNANALLVRGHVMHQLHRFNEAEAIARQLIKIRRNVLDYGLLGDVLMERGKLEEAIQVYQQMVDIKPFFQSYVRAAHVRWLKGDLPGALQLMAAAVDSASSRDPESLAWAWSRLAVYQLQAGLTRQALRSCEAALNYQSNYAPSLLARGRVLMSQGDYAGAVESLKTAASVNPLPEYQWILMEALRAAGRREEAKAVEAQLQASGASADPRTFALYLATDGEQAARALELTQRELNFRSDIFTLDALAWAQANAGKIAEARSAMRRAVAEGTVDARLFFHAAVVAAAAGDSREARHWVERASGISQMLLPSERERLLKLKKELGRG